MVDQVTESGKSPAGTDGAAKKTVSVIVPVYNEIAVIDAFYERMRKVADGLRPVSCEILFVDDGSRDGSYQRLVEIADRDPDVKVVKFSRNFGHQIAITAGIDIARGDAVAVIDSDLQDPPEVIQRFVEKWEEGYDVVYGVREKREGETWMKLFTAKLFYRILIRLTGMEIPVDVGDFRLMSRRVVEKFRLFRERDRFVRGLVSWVGFRQTGVLYHREKRYAGETKYPFRKMLKFAFDGITSFSSTPLQASTWIGYSVSILALLYILYVIVQKIMGNTVPGFATIVVAMLFLGGVQLICLGIIGEYIGRIYNESKARPIYLLEEVYTRQSADAPEGDLRQGV